ncbi:MAG TPA: hypothetical protein PKW98_10815 [Candidatus Wallbacteria bacterium]|nr:MAG: hypothetical protein BWY32_01255 [bacterium ADurb.Bin243]HPG58295.1 hypothetical protein [Candidatus Wallbacteria bacterium]
MQTANVTQAPNYSVNILDIQNSRQAPNEVSSGQSAAPNAAPSFQEAKQPSTQSITPAGIGQNINITA